jgi:DNA modification methylase
MQATCKQQETGNGWSLINADCCEAIKSIPDESVQLGIHSPPFANLYIYSDSERDMGNCADDQEFFKHYEYLIPELLRITETGRLCVVHCKDLPKYANRDGTAGLVDFPGDIVRSFVKCGWSFHSRVTIWKCPVTERERTNNNGLLHKTVLRDRSQLRQGMADYLLVFRKPPEGTLMAPTPILFDGPFSDGPGFTYYVGSCDPRDSIEHPSKFARKSNTKTMPSVKIWQRYADPVWFDISQTNVLNFKAGRGEDDERHICPLQLDVIERCIQLWSNPGDIVFSPFAGIGSEGHGAIQQGRKFIGIELKPEYFNVACRNLTAAENANKQRSLFDMEPTE